MADPREGAVNAATVQIPSERPPPRVENPFEKPADVPGAPSAEEPPPSEAELMAEGRQPVPVETEIDPVAEAQKEVGEVTSALPDVAVEMSDIDELAEDVHTAPAVPAPAAPAPVPVSTHDCGLPAVLMDRVELINYINRHRVTKAHRDSIEYTEVERALFEKYTRARRSKRVNKPFFVAALRLWRHGFPLDPEKSLDLNQLKVGE